MSTHTFYLQPFSIKLRIARFAMQKTENATERSDVEKFVADSINEAATKAVINFTYSNMAHLLRLRNSGSFAEQAANLRDLYDEHMTKAIEFLIHHGWRQAEFAELGKPERSFWKASIPLQEPCKCKMLLPIFCDLQHFPQYREH